MKGRDLKLLLSATADNFILLKKDKDERQGS